MTITANTKIRPSPRPPRAEVTGVVLVAMVEFRFYGLAAHQDKCESTPGQPPSRCPGRDTGPGCPIRCPRRDSRLRLSGREQLGGIYVIEPDESLGRRLRC